MNAEPSKEQSLGVLSFQNGAGVCSEAGQPKETRAVFRALLELGYGWGWQRGSPESGNGTFRKKKSQGLGFSRDTTVWPD